MNRIIFSLFVVLSFNSFSQDNLETVEIEKVINSLFTGMKEGDSSIVHAVFHDDSRLQTSYTNKRNEPALHEENLIEFLIAIGTPHEQIWNERVSNLIIHVDDNLASVWMDYSFYVDENFSHCGVNTMQLVKTINGWKILSIIDTRRKDNCNK